MTEEEELIQDLADELEDYINLYITACNFLEEYVPLPENSGSESWEDYIYNKIMETRKVMYS